MDTYVIAWKYVLISLKAFRAATFNLTAVNLCKGKWLISPPTSTNLFIQNNVFGDFVLSSKNLKPGSAAYSLKFWKEYAL